MSKIAFDGLPELIAHCRFPKIHLTIPYDFLLAW